MDLVVLPTKYLINTSPNTSSVASYRYFSRYLNILLCQNLHNELFRDKHFPHRFPKYLPDQSMIAATGSSKFPCTAHQYQRSEAAPKVFCSIKKLFLKIPQFSQETPVLESLFIKVTDLNPKIPNFIKKRLQRRCFPVNNREIFKNTYFQEHLRTASSERCF